MLSLKNSFKAFFFQFVNISPFVENMQEPCVEKRLECKKWPVV